MRFISVLVLCLAALQADAARLQIKGLVTDAATRAPLPNSLVRLYRNGAMVKAVETGADGRYAVELSSGAEYVLRFSMPGRVTKCFAIDARGPEWEGDRQVASVEVEMTLFERVEGLDLSFFDLPMGLARFTPMTGYLSWNREYEARIRPEAARLYAEVRLRLDQALAAKP